MNFCIGPVTKNTVDVVIDIVNEFDHDFSFIPSRRQIEYNGGYVNNWTTEEFCKYVKEKSNNKIIIERDHGGPGQGKIEDDGLESFKEDCKYMDIIHIDPWKKYPSYNEGLKKTIELIEYCYSQNSNILYEIGTEEGIRPFSVEELDTFVSDIKRRLIPSIFEKIKYVVIQCGTRLLEQTNIGVYDEDKLQKMLNVVNKYGLIAKEHNGDWISQETIKSKGSYGLSTINIAPEFGSIETTIILNEIKKNPEHFETLYQICYNSNTWKKWVSADFIPEENKEKLIIICGHYIFMNPLFLQLKEKYPEIDDKIKLILKYRFYELLNIYSIRKRCIICDSNDLSTFFDNDYETTLSFSLYNDPYNNPYFIPYNILSCNKCKTIQTKYLGDLKIIYGNNHVDSFGATKNDMFNKFSEYILNNDDINSIIEVGACTNSLALSILKHKNIKYTIIEADYKGNTDNITIINNFIENVDLNTIKADTLIMSHVFEHFYEPIKILEKLYNSNIKNIYLNHPNFDYYCKNNVYNILNFEHIFYIENMFLIKLFEKYGFYCDKKNIYDYNNHSLFIHFTRLNELNHLQTIQNINSLEDTKLYFKIMHKKINKLNVIIQDKSKNYYIWPASAHNVTLFVNGLNYKNFKAILDNSPNKINKYLYGYNLECKSLTNILNENNENNCIIIGCSGNYIKELNLNNIKSKILFFENI